MGWELRTSEYRLPIFARDPEKPAWWGETQAWAASSQLSPPPPVCLLHSLNRKREAQNMLMTQAQRHNGKLGPQLPTPAVLAVMQ